MTGSPRIVPLARNFLRFSVSPRHSPASGLFAPPRSIAPFSATTSTRHGSDAQGWRPTYNRISDVEYLERYSPGGYHPIMIGDTLHDRYRVVDKLGFGGYATVWLAYDTRQECYVAVKVGTANSPPQETATLRALSAPASTCLPLRRGRDAIPLPLDEFVLQGPNGTHPCHTTAVAECNLREVSYSRLFPISVARVLSGKLALAVAYIHSRGYAHGDIHLSNVLTRLSSNFSQLSVDQLYEEYGDPETVPITRCDGKPLTSNVPAVAVVPLKLSRGKKAKEFSLSDTRILLSDFGESSAPGSQPRLGKDCHTPLGFRPPEARFEPDAPLSHAADIWCLATTIWEMLGMRTLFSTEFATEDDVTAQQVDVLGPMPPEWWQRWDVRGRFFGEGGRSLKEDPRLTLRGAFEADIQTHRLDGEYGWRGSALGAFHDEEAAAIVELMRRMMAFRPEDRPTAEEVLRSEWMTRWVWPDVEQSWEEEEVGE